MGTCNIDHSLADVKQKLADQKEFLPQDLFDESSKLLEGNPDQLTLNELFHFLKKYDLATDEEKEERNRGMRELLDR